MAPTRSRDAVPPSAAGSPCRNHAACSRRAAGRRSTKGSSSLRKAVESSTLVQIHLPGVGEVNMPSTLSQVPQTAPRSPRMCQPRRSSIATGSRRQPFRQLRAVSPWIQQQKELGQRFVETIDSIGLWLGRVDRNGNATTATHDGACSGAPILPRSLKAPGFGPPLTSSSRAPLLFH